MLLTGVLWERLLGPVLSAHRAPDNLRLQDVKVSEEFHHDQGRLGEEHRWYMCSCFVDCITWAYITINKLSGSFSSYEAAQTVTAQSQNHHFNSKLNAAGGSHDAFLLQTYFFTYYLFIHHFAFNYYWMQWFPLSPQQQLLLILYLKRNTLSIMNTKFFS